MYLPLAGHNDAIREETFRTPLGSKSNLQNVLPANNAHKPRNQKQEQQHSKEKRSPEEEPSFCSQKRDVVDKFYSSSSMSTQDFVALSNFAQDNSFAYFSKKNYF
jgi:hypothetical protein